MWVIELLVRERLTRQELRYSAPDRPYTAEDLAGHLQYWDGALSGVEHEPLRAAVRAYIAELACEVS